MTNRPESASITQSLKHSITKMAILLVCLISIPAIAGACPGCKEALFDPGQLAEKLATAKGYALSIGVLLAVPFLLIGGYTLAIARAARRAKRMSGS